MDGEGIEELKVLTAREQAVKFTCCRNRCKHQGGRFELQDVEDSVVKCALHGWELDMKTLDCIIFLSCLI